MTTELTQCTHRKEIPGHFSDPWIDEDGESHNVWVESRSSGTFVDIDLHRYKCTQCGKVFYYSQAAEDFYERGIELGRFTKEKLCK